MPALIKNFRSPDEWRDIAQKIATRVTNGPGSTHARVEYIRDLLISVATENYEAGKKDAQEEVKAGVEAVLSQGLRADGAIPSGLVEQRLSPNDVQDIVDGFKKAVAADEAPTPDMYH